MKLQRKALEKKAFWQQQGIQLPGYDVAAMAAYTKENPVWLHFGAGNIFRAFIARIQQQLLQQGLAKSGIIAADTFDFDIIDQIYSPYDCLTMLVLMHPDGTLDKEIIASVAEGLKADSSCGQDFSRIQEICVNPNLQMISFTITEKGYALHQLDGELLPVVRQDMDHGPKNPRHAMSVVASLLYDRYQNGAWPLALVSMDNCSHNGEKLQAAVLTIAQAWCQTGQADAGFLQYLKDPKKISFPWSMIDKITPRPAKSVRESLEKLGLEQMEPVITSRNTYIAPYVNAEVPQYLIVEDHFPNGRPPLERAGVYMTDRDTVNNTERMKVTTCLNPLHTALAVYGCLLGYDSIAAEMKDAQLKKLVEKIGYDEGMPVVIDPGILDPMAFIHEVIDLRLPNPFIPDMPQRIATDTSQKVGIRFGETVKAYLASDKLDASGLTYIPLAIAGWLRYLMGVDDMLKPMELSSDPMLAQLRDQLKDIVVGETESCHTQLQPILSNQNLFGVDYYQAGLGEKIESMFLQQISGQGAVRACLEKYLA